jgi:hypothetical protein
MKEYINHKGEPTRVNPNNEPVRMARLTAAAQRYAAADPSDPFALARAMCHIRTGIVGYVERGKDIMEALYDAVPGTEYRKLADSTEYPATVYTSRVRP